MPPFQYADKYANYTFSGPLSSGRTQSVWIYNYVSVGHHYTKDDFVELVDRATDVKARYGLSDTHLQRLRKYRSPSNGFIFSNTPLHSPY